MGENPIQFIMIGHCLGEQFQLSARDHFQARLQIGEKSSRPHLELNHRRQFVQPFVPFDGSINVPVKPENVHFRGGDAVTNGQLAKRIHDRCHVDAVGALAGAGMTQPTQSQMVLHLRASSPLPI
jgi:hypothetical protein